MFGKHGLGVPLKQKYLFNVANFTGWSIKNVPLYFCLYLHQLLTNILAKVKRHIFIDRGVVFVQFFIIFY